jgi:plasmid stabilization system protein ParE
MAQVIWTIKAIEQVEQIGSFIERDSPFQARRVVQLIIKETRKLKEHPRIGKMIPEV